MSESPDGEVEHNPPVLGDVMGFPDDQREDNRRWMVLFSEDYDNFGVDPEGNVAVLVDQEQAGEIVSLGAQIIASLSPRDATGDDVLRDMIEALEQQVGDAGE